MDASAVGDAPRGGPAGGPDPARSLRAYQTGHPRRATAGRVRRPAVRHAAVPGVRTRSPIGLPSWAPTATPRTHTTRHRLPAALRSGRGDLVLLDLWAKLDEPDAVYYDITWMAFCGEEVPAPMREAFAVVVGARDAGIRLVREAMAAGRTLRGFEVDDAVAGHIQTCGYGANIRHRTGHSIGREVHGVGANMDNMETHDERPDHPVDVFLHRARALPAGLRRADGGQRVRRGTRRARDRRNTNRVCAAVLMGDLHV